MKGSDKLMKEILKKAGDEDPKITNLENLAQGGIKGKTHQIRVRNYKSNLISIE